MQCFYEEEKSFSQNRPLIKIYLFLTVHCKTPPLKVVVARAGNYTGSQRFNWSQTAPFFKLLPYSIFPPGRSKEGHARFKEGSRPDTKFLSFSRAPLVTPAAHRKLLRPFNNKLGPFSYAGSGGRKGRRPSREEWRGPTENSMEKFRDNSYV